MSERGGIRFGPGHCPARSPESGVGCALWDAETEHPARLHVAPGGKIVWAVDAADLSRWLSGRLGPHGPEVHDCEAAMPDPEWAWDACAAAEAEPDEGVWTCPVCGWGWELRESTCYDCGRRDGVDWRRLPPAGRQDEGLPGWLPSWLLAPSDGLSGEPAVTAAGGWCAPSETLYDLRTGSPES